MVLHEKCMATRIPLDLEMGLDKREDGELTGLGICGTSKAHA